MKNEIEICERQLGPLETGWSTENYKAGLAKLYELEARLEKVQIQRGLLRSRVGVLSDTVSSPDLSSIEDSPVDYKLPGLKAQTERLRLQVERFQDHWTEYEEGQTTLQPWLAVAEEQLEKNNGSPNLLLQAELNTYNRLREKANNNFSAAVDILPGLQDEEFQRRLHLQFEERWQRFDQKMAEQQHQNQESNTKQSPSSIFSSASELLKSSKDQSEISFQEAQGAEGVLAILHKLAYLKGRLTQTKISLKSLKNNEVDSVEDIGEMTSKIVTAEQDIDKLIEDGNKILESCYSIRRELSNVTIKVRKVEFGLGRMSSDNMCGAESANAKLSSLQELRAQENKLETAATSIQQQINNLESNNGPVGDLCKQLEIVTNKLREMKVKVDQEILRTDDELKTWKRFEAKQLEVRSKIGEASFQLQLSLARGHIDIDRLRKALATVRKLEVDHLAAENMLDELREETVAVQGLAGKQQGAELTAQLESTIVSYNDVCSGLLGECNLKHCITVAGPYLSFSDFGTRYESSLLLWNKFIETSNSIRTWLDQTSLSAAEITASKDEVKSLLVKTKVGFVRLRLKVQLC